MPKVKQTDEAAELPNAFSLLMPSWQAVKLNFITFIELIAIPFMVELLGVIFVRHGHGPGANFIFSILGDVLSLLLAPAMIVVQLASVRGERIDLLPAIRTSLKYFWRYVGLAICMLVIIGVGLALLIVPGLFMLRRYILAPYYLIDQDLKISEALRKSAEQSKRFSNAVWGLLGVEILFVLLVFFIIGFVLSIMYYCAPALRYRQIKEASGHKSPAKA